MKQGVIARSIAAEMAVGFREPVYLEDLSAQWRALPIDEDEDGRLKVRLFLQDFVARYRREVDARSITKRLGGAVAEARDAPEVTARDLIAAARKVFCTAPVDTGEIMEATVSVYARLQTAGEDRTSVSRALAVCRLADDVLNGVKGVVEQFLADRDVAPGAFKAHSDRERLASVVLTDLKTDLRGLATLKAELSSLDSRYSDTRDELLRALASLRLFSDMGMQDTMAGHRTSNPPANTPYRGVSFAPGSAAARTTIGAPAHG